MTKTSYITIVCNMSIFSRMNIKDIYFVQIYLCWLNLPWYRILILIKLYKLTVIWATNGYYSVQVSKSLFCCKRLLHTSGINISNVIVIFYLKLNRSLVNFFFALLNIAAWQSILKWWTYRSCQIRHVKISVSYTLYGIL